MHLIQAIQNVMNTRSPRSNYLPIINFKSKSIHEEGDNLYDVLTFDVDNIQFERARIMLPTRLQKPKQVWLLFRT